MSKPDDWKQRRENVRDFVAEVVADAITADAVILFECSEVMPGLVGVEGKIHIVSEDISPQMLIESLRALANSLEAEHSNDAQV